MRKRKAEKKKEKGKVEKAKIWECNIAKKGKRPRRKMDKKLKYWRGHEKK
jgi:hypothetical protein